MKNPDEDYGYEMARQKRIDDEWIAPAVVRNSRLPRISATCADIKPQRSSHRDPRPDLYFTEEDDFPGWPIALGLMLAAGLGCWGLWHIALWAGRL